MASVELLNVSKIFDKKVVAVKGATFKIEDNEFVVLVGPSGCGKSTTLRMVAGLEQATEGKIFIGDKLVNDIPPKDRDIAMVFQNYALFPHMTVYQNMAFGLRLRKCPKKEIEKRVQEAAEILEITDLLSRKPKALSGGQRQRVAVGRAIVRKPQVFLFDEPLSNLDAKLRVQMRTELLKLHHQIKTTMIYVTHDQMEAMTMGDRIVVMKDGIIHQIDTPLNLYNRPNNRFVAGFIGSPPMNFIKGKLIKSTHIWFDEGQIKLKIPAHRGKRLSQYFGKELIMGIRPEDIHEADFADNLEETAEAHLQVEVAEPIGSEIVLYLNTGTHPIIARISARIGARRQPEIGERIRVLFDMARIHFFNEKTEQIID